MAQAPAALVDALSHSYRIERRLGAGGMATVYLAEDLRHRREVAIKVLRPELGAVIGGERFLAEIRTTAKLQHPHILPLYDSGAAAGLLYYVMPFVEGESLRDRIDRDQQLPIGDVVRIASEVSSALDYAHRHGVIHRDIKPENILLHDGAALVADFGIALAVSQAGGATRLTETGLSLGTPCYMSPEQAMGQRAITAQADVYALGAITYEMLVGEPPFTGPTAQAVAARVLTDQPRPLSTVRRTVPPHLEQAVLAALQKLPADRQTTAAEFARQLATPDAATLPRPATRRRPAMALVAGALVAGAALSALAFGALRQPTSSPFGRATRISWQPGLELQPAISPDGRFIAYGAGSAVSTTLFVRQVAGGRAERLTADSTTSQSAPTWSPDGSRILYLAAGTVFSAPSAGGPPRQEVRARSGGAITSADWASDGDAIAFAAGDSVFIQAANDTARFLAAVESPNNCRWSPDARSIACASGNSSYSTLGPLFGNLGASAIVEITVADGSTRYLTDSATVNQSPVWTPDGDRVLFVSNRLGPLDIYSVRSGRTGDTPMRLTTGLGAQWISIAADGELLAYSVLRDASNIWSLPLSDGPVDLADATPITHGTQLIDVFSISQDGRWILYSADLAGNGDIYRVPAEGGQVERLTIHPGGDWAPHLSPGPKEEVTFHSWRAGTRDIFVMPLDGGPVQTVVASPRQEVMPHWSPDATTIAFGYLDLPGGISVVRRSPDGSWGVPRVRSPVGWWPAWSPDGSYIAYSRSLNGGSLMVVSADSGPPRTLMDATQPGMPQAVQPFFRTDGSEILFYGHDARGVPSIWRLPATGGSLRRVIEFDDPQRPVYRPFWALGADRIYVLVQEQQSETWVVERQR
ncbi:MAG TPA: protein kinase [Gemmatimonadales bacterium]|nr:protein kinase [Gemmatimonadales bacterium]